MQLPDGTGFDVSEIFQNTATSVIFLTVVDDENTIVIVFKVVGQGTEILKNKQIGDQLDCLIGLGNGFTVQEGKALLIGG